MDTVPTPEVPIENNIPPAAADIVAPSIEPRQEVVGAIIPEKTEKKGKERTQFKPGDPPGPGRPKGRKDNRTIIEEASIQLLADILQAQPSKRFYKRWLKNYAARHPKEALELVVNVKSKLSSQEKGDTHLHLNLSNLVAAAGKKAEAKND